MTHLPKRIAQLLIVLVLLVGTLHLSVTSVHAGGEFYGNYSLGEMNKQWDNAANPPSSTAIINPGPIIASQGNWLLFWILKSTGGCTGNSCTVSSFNNSALGTVANAMDVLYKNPPADFGMYARDFLANAGLAKPAYAQGIGFTGLAPILPLWKGARNIAYVILVIVMVAIGFMIIFRMKLDPKTVITVQAALPKIIFTLILITFSYAIAGFLIDIMYVSIAIIVTLLNQAAHEILTNVPSTIQLKTPAQDIHDFLSGGIFTLGASVFHTDLLLSGLTNGVAGSLGNLIAQLGLATVATVAIFTVPITGGAAFLVWPFITLLPLVIIFLGLLFTFIRLLVLLFNSYIQILISVILGPILLLQEAIPGKSAFSGWILNLLANLSVFPATIAVLYFSWLVAATSICGNLWAPPLLAPLAGGSSGTVPTTCGSPLSIFLGLSIIFLAPTLVVSVKKIFSPKPILPITAGTALSPLTGAVGTTMGAASQFYYMQQIFSEKGPLAGILNTFKGKKNES